MTSIKFLKTYYSNSKIYVLIVLMALLFLGCGTDDSGSDPGADYTTINDFKHASAENSELAEQDNYSGSDYTEFNRKAFTLSRKNSGNWVTSPASSLQGVGILAEAASGETLQQLIGLYPFLEEIPNPVSFQALEQPDVSLTNIVMGQENYRYLTSYLEAINALYQPEFCSADFLHDPGAAISELNNHVSALIPPELKALNGIYGISEDSRVVTVNITSISIDTDRLFNVNRYYEGLFEDYEGMQYRVPHLEIQGDCGIYRSDDITAVDVSAPESDFSVLFVFPKKRSVFTTFISDFETSVNTLLDSMSHEDVIFSIPEITVQSTYDMTYIAGIADEDQDFSSVNGLGYLKLKGLYTETAFTLNAGTLSATGSSCVIIDATEDEPDSVWTDGGDSLTGFISVSENHQVQEYIKEGEADSTPFLFIIRSKQSGTILFTGNVSHSGGKEAGEWVVVDPYSF